MRLANAGKRLEVSDTVQGDVGDGAGMGKRSYLNRNSKESEKLDIFLPIGCERPNSNNNVALLRIEGVCAFFFKLLVLSPYLVEMLLTIC